MHKEYLGDSVYVEVDDADGRSLMLTTENGFGPNNTIILEPEVFAALVRYERQRRLARTEVQNDTDQT